MAAPADVSPWVIVAGGFHPRGGMDRANAELAAFLASAGTPVHLVAHEIDASLIEQRLVTAHVVRRPAGMPALAERLLGRAGGRVARAVTAQAPGARVVVNGGNCVWPDVNWVHAVHHAWPVHDADAPWWSRIRNRRLKQFNRGRERASLAAARVVIANSEATRRVLVDEIGVPRDHVRTVYLGSDPKWGPADAHERQLARTSLGITGDRPVVAFVGALGTDTNKGFDVLWDAWKALQASENWTAQLVVAGGGWRSSRWQAEAARDASDAVRFLGFTPRVREVLAAADLLVSPVRYEAYGLNVHEALCRGVAVMVTRTAGVVERFDPVMSEALLPENVTPALLADRLRLWRNDPDGWRTRVRATGARLRSRSWADMAAELVGIVAREPRRIPA